MRRPDGLAYYCRACFREVNKRSYRKRMALIGKTVREPREVPPGHRWCPDCAAPRPLVEFGYDASSPTGLTSYCRSHQQARIDASRERLHGSSRNYHLKHRYGVTEAEVAQMLQAQGGRCPICRRDLGPSPHVDHDHADGAVRGLLCFTCNVGLGNFADDVERLLRAAQYVTGTLGVDRAPAEPVDEACSTEAAVTAYATRRPGPDEQQDRWDDFWAAHPDEAAALGAAVRATVHPTAAPVPAGAPPRG